MKCTWQKGQFLWSWFCFARILDFSCPWHDSFVQSRKEMQKNLHILHPVMKNVLDICYSTFSHLLLIDLSDCRYCCYVCYLESFIFWLHAVYLLRGSMASKYFQDDEKDKSFDNQIQTISSKAAQICNICIHVGFNHYWKHLHHFQKINNNNNIIMILHSAVK